MLVLGVSIIVRAANRDNSGSARSGAAKPGRRRENIDRFGSIKRLSRLRRPGVRSNRCERGALAPQEYVLREFHEELRRRLADAGAE